MSSFPQLTGNVDALDDRDALIEGLRAQNRKLDEALRLERNKNGQIEASVRELRRLTYPFYQLFRAIHGEIDAMGIEESSASVSAPAASMKSSAWEMWKGRLGAPCAKIIDALKHGAMTQTQLSIATGINIKNMSTYIYKINKAGLISKNGNEYSLKEL